MDAFKVGQAYEVNGVKFIKDGHDCYTVNFFGIVSIANHKELLGMIK